MRENEKKMRPGCLAKFNERIAGCSLTLCDAAGWPRPAPRRLFSKESIEPGDYVLILGCSPYSPSDYIVLYRAETGLVSKFYLDKVRGRRRP